MTNRAVTRRDFVKVTGAASAALVLGVHLPACRPGDADPRARDADGFAPNAWVRIDAEGVVTILVDRSEMGQGVATALPMLVAEELEVDWESVRFAFASGDPAYANPLVGTQATGGSTSVRVAWEPLRTAGAAARVMLIAAAAEQWGVPASECRAERGAVEHAPSGRRAAYGTLVEAAAGQRVPESVPLKDPADFKLIGTPRPRLDTPQKVDGTATFGIDVRVPGMVVATVARCPVFGGHATDVDDRATLAVPGVQRVVRMDHGVGVLADTYWSALQGKRALKISWDEGEHAQLASDAISTRFREMAARPGAVARNDGNVDQAMARAARTVQAVYELPFLAHATMEPMNATAHVRPDGCDVWAPTQNQGGCRRLAASITGLEAEKIAVHTTFLGGGFGRRFELDFVTDALELSKATGRPVKVVWSREDDIQHDFYRPASYHVLRAGLDGDGWPVAWSHRIVCPSVMGRVFPDFIKDGVDQEAVEGAVQLPYEIPNVVVDYHRADTGVPVGFWRSVNHSQNAFAIECFLDEVARATARDPLALRQHLLAGRPRYRRVVEMAAERAGWRTPAATGRARGLALHESFGSIVAQVAEVSATADTVRVHRVTCAVDCGPVVNPNTVEAQLESAVVYGLTAALYGEVTIQNGRAVQSNFHDYRMLRMNEMPAIDVHMIAGHPTPGGVGEIGTPPIAPAVANALARARGTRIRRLPMRA